VTDDDQLKVLTLVGTRPELIKLSRVIAELERCTRHGIVHSGQNSDYELNEIFFQELGLPRPTHFLNAVGETAAETIGRVIAKFDAVVEAEQPDAVLVYGDTNTGLGVLAAKRRKVPVFHMEAGNRCFDERVPEEINRRLIDHVSDVNMANSEVARSHLLREGLRPDLTFMTGSPMREVLEHCRDQIDASDVLDRLGLAEGRYFLVSSHREENVDDPGKLADLCRSLEAVVARYHEPIVFSVHPRTEKRLAAAGLTAALPGDVHLARPFGFHDYVRLELGARCVLSDSGTLTEEAAILGFPAVMLRESHERLEGMDAGVLTFSGVRPTNVLRCVALATARERVPIDVPDYGSTNVAANVAAIVNSYVDYVNRVAWQRQTSGE
jgi:UDP-N-acetylglucosamine 2-epimerase